MSELRDLGYEPEHAQPIRARKGRPGCIFLVILRRTPDITPAIYGITELLCIPGVTIESWRGKRGPAQCHRCQGFRHSSHQCHRALACVKCGEGHRTADCPLPKGATPRCANCKGAHPANHSTCPVLKEEARNKRAGTVALAARGMGASEARGRRRGGRGGRGARGAHGAHGAPGAGGGRGAQGVFGARGAHGAPGAPGAPSSHGAHGALGVRDARGPSGAPGAPGARGAHGATAPAPTPAAQARRRDEPREYAQADPRAHGQHFSQPQEVEMVTYPAEPPSQRRRRRGGRRRGRGGVQPPAPPRAEPAAHAEAGPSRAAADSAPVAGATRAADQRAARPRSGGPLRGQTLPSETAIAEAVDRAVTALLGALYPTPSEPTYGGRRSRSRGVRQRK